MKLDHGLQKYGWDSAAALTDQPYSLPAIKSLLPPGKLNVLDTGCDNGFITGQITEIGYQVMAIGLSDDGIEIARKKCPNVRFEVSSVYDDLSDLADRVDVVVSSEIIEHIYCQQHFLNNINPIIREEGGFDSNTPYNGDIKNLVLSIFNKWDSHHTVDW